MMKLKPYPLLLAIYLVAFPWLVYLLGREENWENTLSSFVDSLPIIIPITLLIGFGLSGLNTKNRFPKWYLFLIVGFLALFFKKDSRVSKE